MPDPPGSKSFDELTEIALEAHDLEAAIRSAPFVIDADLFVRVVTALDSRCVTVAQSWFERGFFRPAAVAFEHAEQFFRAAVAFERAGDPVQSARCYCLANDVRAAAKVLTQQVRQYPDDYCSAYELGVLLAREHRHEAALRALQTIPSTSPFAALSHTAIHSILTQQPDGLSPIDSLPTKVTPMPPSARSSGDTTTIPLVLGRFRAETLVSTTNTARVFQGTDLLTHRPVAIKIVRGATASLFGRDVLLRVEREFAAMTTLRHRSVVSVLAFARELPALVSEWMPGGTLADQLQRALLAPSRAVDVAMAVLEALAHTHLHGVLHRDIKPSNIFFDQTGAAMLGDFGAAHFADHSQTITRGIIGTLDYMAPEIRQGYAASTASDIYSVGITLFQSMFGQIVSNETTIVPPSERLDSLTKDHDEALMALIQQEPNARISSALDAVAKLRSVRWPSSLNHSMSSIAGTPIVSSQQGALRVHPVLGCPVLTVPDSPEWLRLAQCFARAAHPSLARVFRVDRLAQQIWIEQPAGEQPSAVEALGTSERRWLREAVLALHQQGGVHGSIGLEAVRVHPIRGVVLCFPREISANASCEGDLIALSKIVGELG